MLIYVLCHGERSNVVVSGAELRTIHNVGGKTFILALLEFRV